MPASLLPEVRAALIPWLQTIERPEWIWLTWRPALYLYLSLFCVTAIAIRHRSWRTAGLALPVAAQSMVWMLLLTVQDFRFQYPVYVVSLLTLGLLFVPSIEPLQNSKNAGTLSLAVLIDRPSWLSGSTHAAHI